MAHLNSVILGRNLDGENIAEILDLAKLTLANPAVADEEPLRKAEHDVAFSGLDSRVTAMENSSMHVDAVYVDVSSPDLATALSETGVSWDDTAKHWIFPGGIELATGDLLILNASAEEEHRSWVMNNTLGGTADDFTPLGTDIDSSIDAAITALVDGAPESANTLGKITASIGTGFAEAESARDALDLRLTAEEGKVATLETEQAKRPEFKVHTGTFTLNGSIYELEFANPFNTHRIQVEVQSDESAGTWHKLSDNEVDVHITDSLVSITTASSSVGAHSLEVMMNGIVA